MIEGHLVWISGETASWRTLYTYKHTHSPHHHHQHTYGSLTLIIRASYLTRQTQNAETIAGQVSFGLEDRCTLSDKLEFLCPSVVMDSGMVFNGFSSFLSLHIQSSPGNRWAQNWARRALASTALSNQDLKPNLSCSLLIQFWPFLLFRYSTFIWLQHHLNKRKGVVLLSSYLPKNGKIWCLQGNTGNSFWV